MELNPIIPVATAIIALIAAFVLGRAVMKHAPGNDRMIEISNAVKDGAMAYMNRQYKTIAYVAAAIVVLFLAVWATRTGSDRALWLWTTIGFVIGAVFSGLAGYIGMSIAVRANTRVAHAASDKDGLAKGLNIAFKGGAVSGLAVAGLALLGLGGFYYLFSTYQTALGLEDPIGPLIGYAFGASLISLFARVGGGIYTKAADVGADLVGKLEAGIPEDDPRNPAVIADNVGDNVGDCAGMGADLFETYVVTVVAAVFLGFLLPANLDLAAKSALITFPLFLGAAAMVASIIGVFFVRLGKDQDIMKALYRGVYASIFIAVGLFWVLSRQLLGDYEFTQAGILGMGNRLVTADSIFAAAVVGLVVTLVLMYITEYYTGTTYRPVQKIAKASETGAATNIISGLAVGMESTFLPVIAIALAMFAAFFVAGVYGIAIAAVAMLGIAGMVVAMDTYGPITDNAGGIAEMAELPEHTRKNTDALDAVGNTTKAVTKGYAVGSAALAALALFADYVHRLPDDVGSFALDNPLVLIGLIIGAMLPFLFSAFLMNAVGVAAGAVIEEVRRQFREIKGIMTGEGKPDYATCVDIVTKSALKQMILPGVLAVVAPLIVGFLFGPLALGGLLIGVLAGGLMLALSMANGGGAWDNAKKLIEDGNYGGKGSVAHEAAVVGDTVGDPYKDTAGPSINALIKVINTVSLIFAGLIASSGGILLGL
jgi:K(+)-stimulated pyrophosphate-energized sodium pump